MSKVQKTLVMILGFCVSVVAMRGQATDESQAKASFLFNLAKFVEWPAESFKSPNDPILCCMLGDGPYERKLEQITNPQYIEKRRFIFQHVVSASQLSGCHMLFVNPLERKRWGTLSSEVKGRSILTVGESEEFISEGGIIRFNLDNGKVRMQINVDAAGQEKLRINSRLLNLARIVGAK